MDNLPAYGLANTITGFATLFSGLLPIALCYLANRHPARWMFVYWMIALTGVFTITLHGFGETNPVWGERWWWAFLDTGSNIVVAWSIILAVLADFYAKDTIAWARPVATVLMLVGVAWHFYDRFTGGSYVISFGAWGGFKPGQTWLIAFSLAAAALFYIKRRDIEAPARRLLTLTTAIFVVGLLLATARSDNVVMPFFSLHAIWHVVGAFGFVSLWAFNDLRFRATNAPG